MLKFLKRITWQEKILFITVFFVGFPTVFVIWAFVDDGYAALISQRMTGAILDGNVNLFFSQIVEPELGRLRPFYWIYQWLTFIVGGYNHFYHHLIHFGLLLLTSFLLFKIVKEISKSSNAAFLSVLFFIINKDNVENWYRLGPQEPLLVFLLLGSFYFLLKSTKNIFFILSLVFLFCAYFTKETSLAFLPVSFLFFLFKRNKYHFVYFLSNLFLAILTRGIAMTLGSFENNYASFYQLDFSRIVHNTLLLFRHVIYTFDPLIFIAISAFLFTVIFHLKNNKFRSHPLFIWRLIGLMWFFSFVLIQSPWEFVLTRYLLPAYVGLSIFLGIEYKLLLDFLKSVLNDKSLSKEFRIFFVLSKWFVFFLFFLILTSNVLSVLNYQRFVTTDFDEQMLKLISVAPEGATVYFNFEKGDANMELNYEIPLHLRLFFDRQDLNFNYLDSSSETLFKNGDLILSGNGVPAYSEEEIKSFSNVLEKKHFERKFNSFNIMRPEHLFLTMITFKKPKIPLYSVNHSCFNWYVYQFFKNTKN